jgi:ABC-2 type transport system permease protein
MKSFIALIKREVLEHKNLWRVPVVLLGIALLMKMSFSFGNLNIDIDVPNGFNIESTVDSFVFTALGKALSGMNYVIMLVMFVVAIFYALSSLYNERQDQSVLFWRSLPISDTQTILAKLAVAIVVVPVLILLLQSIVAVVFLGGQSADYLASYLSGATARMAKILMWSMLPTIAWCLLCSQLAKKNPFMMALVIPILVILVDKLFLSGVVSDTFVINRLTGVESYTTGVLIIGSVFSAVCIGATIARRGELI